MSIVPVYSSISSGYDSTEDQNLKLKSGKEELSKKNGNITEKAVVESKIIETKAEVSSEDSLAVKISFNGDTIELSKQGMSKTQGMSAASNSALVEPSASNEDSLAIRISFNGDTVELSKQGMSKAQGMSAAPNSASAEPSASTSTSSTANLSNDSDYELKQKLSKGNITQLQYDNEIKKRGKDTESAEVDYSTKQNEEVSK